MPKIAILGGTFNPVHWGHLLIAETALHQAKLDQVIWVPAYRPSHKSSEELVDFHHRLQMVKLAVTSHANFTVSTVEQGQPNPSYAIDTFLGLKVLDPASEWYWIIGLDAFQSLPRWYCHQQLASECCWLVAPRFSPRLAQSSSSWIVSSCIQVAQKMADESINLRWQLLDMPLVEISSRLIRQYCSDRRSIRDLVPESVRDYILTHQLYQN
jgi:nicotinate-nucleotide adenylyltransferase